METDEIECYEIFEITEDYESLLTKEKREHLLSCMKLHNYDTFMVDFTVSNLDAYECCETINRKYTETDGQYKVPKTRQYCNRQQIENYVYEHHKKLITTIKPMQKQETNIPPPKVKLCKGSRYNDET